MLLMHLRSNTSCTTAWKREPPRRWGRGVLLPDPRHCLTPTTRTYQPFLQKSPVFCWSSQPPPQQPACEIPLYPCCLVLHTGHKYPHPTASSHLDSGPLPALFACRLLVGWCCLATIITWLADSHVLQYLRYDIAVFRGTQRKRYKLNVTTSYKICTK
jgi:hypothetical protein